MCLVGGMTLWVAHARACCLKAHFSLGVKVCLQLQLINHLLASPLLMTMRCKQSGVQLLLAGHLTEMRCLCRQGRRRMQIGQPATRCRPCGHWLPSWCWASTK